MNKRSIPILIAGCILAIVGIAGYLIPTSTEALPKHLLMENTGGRVIFSHEAHSTPGGRYGDPTCATCHHDLNVNPEAAQAPPPAVMQCSSCHGAADDPDFIEAHQKRYMAQGGEQTCVSCHHSAMAGLSSRWNHAQHIEDYAGGDCETCHHPYNYEFKPGRTMNIKPQKCSNCHTDKPNPMTATTRKDASHAKCMSCHEDLFDEGIKGCATCHNQISTRDELAKGTTGLNYGNCTSCHAPMLSGMDAFHNQCMGCHDTVKKGPGKAAPCAQCHTP